MTGPSYKETLDKIIRTIDRRKRRQILIELQAERRDNPQADFDESKDKIKKEKNNATKQKQSTRID